MSEMIEGAKDVAIPQASQEETGGDTGEETVSGEVVATDGEEKNTEVSKEAPKDPAAVEAEAKAAAEAAAQEALTARTKAAVEKVKRDRIAKQRANNELLQIRNAAQQTAAQLQRERENAAALKRQLDELTSDPLKGFEKLGVRAEDVARRAVEQSTPEAKLRAEIEASLRTEFNSRIEAVEAERKALIAQQETQRQAEHRANDHRAFISEASKEELYPTIAEFADLNPNWVISEAYKVKEEANARGLNPSGPELLEHLEYVYAEKRAARKTGASKSATVTKTETQETKTGTSPPATKTASPPRTISNQAASARGTLPPNFEDLDDREQNRILGAMLASGAFSSGG